MKILLSAAAVLALMGSAHADDIIELQFQRASHENNTTVGVLVSVKNATNTDIAAMTWSCDLFDRGGQQIARGDLVTFTMVPKNAIAVDTQYLYVNGGIFHGANCQLIQKEDLTDQNARLYRPGPQRANVPIDDAQFWNSKGSIHGTTRGAS